ncbi:metallophosphoesterase [Spirulina subsalsa FACHB-351]|uniref:Metallophosphoesterase n=1 Tax=Spirulina subsalsa FACHB-351 TaxID=234711 RepID=A0ABT3L9T0_9CYAN|nr:metallophosphoesterase [Spirulina subsalsa]MCW6038273.1 metallophosphoesterase [Spirulina subsalsa FACHB-351]
MQPIFVEPLTVERVTIKIPDLIPSLQGTKLVHLSDLHYDGKRLEEELLTETIELTNQEKPDLVVLTGDYITDNPSPIYNLALHLKYLESRCGVVACLGNHDNYFPFSRHHVVKALTGVGIEVLWNAIAYPLGSALPVIGFADLWSREFRPQPIMEQLDPDTPRLVLSHNPDTAALLQPWRVDLQLSGHTHGGQVVLPGLGSVPSLMQPVRHHVPKSLHPYIPILRECARVVKHWEWGQGYHAIEQNQLYVNRGLGTYFPGRINCPPELTVITLIRGCGE